MNSRETALKALYEVEKNGAYSDKALKKLLGEGSLSSADRAFASELTYGVIRHKLRIDYIIQHYSSQKLRKLSEWILNILRIGVYQIIFLDKIPQSAAVNECVKLAKRYGHSASAGFVNAVLRAISRGGDVKCPSLSVFYSHPDWLTDLICEQYPDDCKKILSANNTVPTATVRVNILKTNTDRLCELFKQKDISANSDGNIIEISKFGDISSLDEYKSGLFTPQDKAAYLAAAAINPKPDEFIIDVCAAPGGKTTQMAEMSDDKAEIIAFDVHEHKLSLIQKNAQRLGINSIKCICHDAVSVKKEYIGKANKVLADVPCSGLGIIRKKPDIKWTKTPKDLEEIIKLQKQILEASSQYVKKGGILVYSTCTINKNENNGVVNNFLENAPFEKAEETQLLPHKDNCDGFYYCVLKKL